MNEQKTSSLDLSWFDLKKYDRFKEMTKVEWLDQLSARKRIIEFLTETSKKESLSLHEEYNIEYIFKKIKNDPEIDTSVQYFSIERPMHYQRVFESAHNWDSNLSIRQCTLEEAVTILRGVDQDKVNTVNKMYSYLESDPNTRVSDPSYNDVDWMVQPVDTVRDDILPSLSLLVDLKASDAVLLDQFAAQLKIYRKQLSITNPRTKLEKFNRANLIKYGVVPYIDLQLIWGNYHDQNINESRLSEMISAVENAWTPDNMKTSTIKWVKAVLSDSFQDNLAKEAQIDHQEIKMNQTKSSFLGIKEK